LTWRDGATGEATMATVTFTRMADGTAEDYALLYARIPLLEATLVDRVLDLLKVQEPIAYGYRVDRVEHARQCATRAFRDGADEETVAAALIHDIGDTLAPWNHAQIGADILEPYVSAGTHWMVAMHAYFQTYYYNHHFGKDPNEREKYRGHPYFERTCLFCERYDQNSFDPGYDSMPLEAFEPVLRRIFARKPWQLATRDVA
jgi:predicted HD phosphohydrolase